MTFGRVPGKGVRKRRLRCHWCRGAHPSDRCPNPSGKRITKAFGTVNEHGSYVPPDGVPVRVMVLPYNLHGDQLSKVLKELDG